MSQWLSSRASKVLRALQRIGWREKARISKSGSHKQLEHPNFSYEFTWAFHDGDEIGPVMLSRIAKQTGLKPEDI
ncbi:MAG: type II toxin-antitoxin system HicA family toxin [Terracidiphilus sp.]|jgi:predicted RNA binding protein YcfA (HicA-like mRNA interferase family)